MMRLLTLPVFLVLFVTSSLHAQYLYILPSTNFQKAADIEAAKLAVDRDDIDGSPMLTNDWGNGAVKLKSGKAYNELVLQFNLTRNQLYFQRNSVAYVFNEPVLECELNYMENGTPKNIFLKSGFPAINDKDSNTLYQALVIGDSVQLLKFVGKKIVELKSIGAPPQKYYDPVIAYYVYDVKSGTMENVKINKSSLLTALPGHSKEIEQYTGKIKSEADCIMLIKSLNSK